MDIFSGWPFYGRRGGWDDPGCGCYGARAHPSMRPSLYDDPFYHDAEWCSGASHFPFHRPTKHHSPFERRRRTPFDNVYDVEQPPSYPRRTPKAHVEPDSPNKPANGPSVAMGEGVNKSKKPAHTMDVTTASSSPYSADETSNLTPPSSSVKDPTNSTPQTMESHNQEDQLTKPDQPKTDLVSSEIKRIEEIMKKSTELKEKIEAYSGVPGSKSYIYIEESLVAILLQLDKVETNGNVEIRKARKSAVCMIQQMLTDLENKAKSNMASTETESQANNVEEVVTDETMDVSSVEQPSMAAGGEDIRGDEGEESTLTVDPSNTTDEEAAVVIGEEISGEASTEELTDEQSTITTVGPSSLVTSDGEKPAAVSDDEDGNNVVKNDSTMSTEDMDINKDLHSDSGCSHVVDNSLSDTTL